jgi:hypothetical protein
MTTLAEEFGVSGLGLAESVRAFGVPVLREGYSAKLQNRALPALAAALRSLFLARLPVPPPDGFGT